MITTSTRGILEALAEANSNWQLLLNSCECLPLHLPGTYFAERPPTSFSRIHQAFLVADMVSLLIYGTPPDPVPFDRSTFDPCSFPDDHLYWPPIPGYEHCEQPPEPKKEPEAKPEVPRTFILEPNCISIDSDVVTGDLTFRSTKQIHDGHSSVYKGILSGYSSDTLEVVCKLVTGTKAIDRLRRETKMYETKLCDMQGTGIPIFYGMYTGTVDSEPAACLILEYCGETVGDFSRIKLLWRSVRVAFTCILASLTVSIS